jgi:hypothetical protein
MGLLRLRCTAPRNDNEEEITTLTNTVTPFGLPQDTPYGLSARRDEAGTGRVTRWGEGEQLVLVDNIPENMFVNESADWKDMR